MNGQSLKHYIKTLRQQIAELQAGNQEGAEASLAAILDDFELLSEEMESSKEAARLIERELIKHNQQLTEKCQYFESFLQTIPIAYLVTDAEGMILEANQTLADLLSVSQEQLIRRPLGYFIEPEDWPVLRLAFAHLAQAEGTQTWQMRLTSSQRDPIDTELQVAIIRNADGAIETLQIGVHDLTRTYDRIAKLSRLERAADTPPAPPLPHALDGLRVLFVDDEADAREFVTAVLESQGIRVTAVASAAAALEAIAQNRPDVLVSDIRMTEQDGYALIRRVRALEAERGWHIPAAALTAYLDESRDKALSAGFEAHLHKLARPDALIDMVSRLARQKTP